jgi:hypothetical protein
MSPPSRAASSRSTSSASIAPTPNHRSAALRLYPRFRYGKPGVDTRPIHSNRSGGPTGCKTVDRGFHINTVYAGAKVDKRFAQRGKSWGSNITSRKSSRASSTRKSRRLSSRTMKKS